MSEAHLSGRTQNRAAQPLLKHPRTRNAAVIRGKRSLRFPEMTPALLLQFLSSPGDVRKSGSRI